MRVTSKYDGDAHMSVHGKKVRVWIEAPNVTAEVYVTHKKAREMAEHILSSLAALPVSGQPGRNTGETA